MSAPLTPRFSSSPRRVVKLEYETPQFLVSPACLHPQSGCVTLSTGASTSRRKRTPRRIITSEVDGHGGEHEGREYLDIITSLMERGCSHIIQRIFSYVHERDLNSIQCVCSKWRRALTRDTVSRRRQRNFFDEMQLLVLDRGVENAPSPKVAVCVSEKVMSQRASFGMRNALSDLSNTSTLKRDPKLPKTSSSTPSRQALLEPGYRPTKLSGLTPEDAIKKAKKMTSAKKDSRTRRLRC